MLSHVLVDLVVLIALGCARDHYVIATISRLTCNGGNVHI